MRRSCAVALLTLHVAPVALIGQSAHTLAGRHQLSLTVGLNTSAQTATAVGVPGVTVSSSASGVLGGLGYGYWLDDRLAVGARVLAMDASADVSASIAGARVESAVVGTVQFGLKYQFAHLTPSNALRPHLAVSVGPLFGSAEKVAAGFPTSASTVQQTVVGSEVSLGAELSLGRHVSLGVDAGYLFAGSFDQRIGARDNYSSPVLALSVSFLVGRGRSASPP